MDINLTWEEVLSLLKAYKRAEEADNEEDMLHICNVLPDEIKMWDDDILIKI